MNAVSLTKRFAPKRFFLLLWALPVVLAVICLGVGRFDIELTTVLKILASHLFPIEPTWSAMDYQVVMVVRFPRVILALFIGAGLAISGASFQGMFANPLVSPDILGVAAGSGFGAALGILWFGHGYHAQLLALVFGLLAIGFMYVISGARQNAPIFMLVLAGVVTSALFNAMISLIKFLADPEDKLPTITYWLMGSLATSSYRDVWLAMPMLLIGMGILWLLRWRMNLLTLSDEEAKSLGVPVLALKWSVILGATLCTAASVSVAGIVGWVGLIMPHMARMLVGINHERVLPMAMLLGSSYLLIIDTFARSLTAAEIPLSILTAILGAPLFAYLLRKTGGRWA